MKYADVIIDISLEALDRVFQYKVPDASASQICIGSRVVVPFGHGNRRINGYVIGFSDQTDYPEEKIKAVIAVEESAVTIEAQMIELAVWMSQVYGCTRAQAFKTVLNVKRQIRQEKEKIYKLKVSKALAEKEMKKLAETPRFAARAAVLALFLDAESDNVSYENICAVVSQPKQALQTLVKHGFLELIEETKYRNPFQKVSDSKVHELSIEQQKAVDDILNDQRMVHLLYGVTGSGKTEVYIALIEEMLACGKQAIVLIPEISLTYQNISRFRKYFGSRVTVMNSKMSEGEKYDQYRLMAQGAVDILIGPRSALFAPFSRLGLIIIDEEHDQAYKSDMTPKYHAIDVASHRVKQCGGKLVLGSATPSIVSYDRAVQGIYGFHCMKQRVSGSGRMSEVSVVDLREEMKQKNYSIFSRELVMEMEKRIGTGAQTMLFLNRRGYAGFISCRSCGYVVKCPNCDVSLTLHKFEGNRLKCHYCGYQIPMPKQCPSCRSPYIGAFGIGTEKVVEMIKERFPAAVVLRADRDTMKRKNSYIEVFKTFAEGKADILVGTQMIVKGHDFPNVTLVGVIAADLSMFSGDYMASERTFQLLTQAAGRAGRGEANGRTVIQTYQPDHYAIRCAAKQDYESFYKQEIAYRALLQYPPKGMIMVVLIEHGDDEKAQICAEKIGEFTRLHQIQALPPVAAFRGKEKNIYRKVIYIKTKKSSELFGARSSIQQFLKEQPEFKDINIQFDINPINLY